MDTFIHEDARLAVKKGIYWLDENHPGWVSQINLSALDMAECQQCVIGQAVGDYTTTTRRAANTTEFRVGTIWAVEHGFESPRVAIYQEYGGSLTTYGYTELEVLWSEEVKRRLG